jgi:hypothetical protein
MTDEQKLQAAEDALDGLSIERGRMCREIAAELGMELTNVQKVIQYVDSKPIEWQEALWRELEQRQKP